MAELAAGEPQRGQQPATGQRGRRPGHPRRQRVTAPVTTPTDAGTTVPPSSPGRKRMNRGIRRWLAVPGLALAMGTMAACHPTPPWHPGGDGPQSTHLNQIQVVGSHNSYHGSRPRRARPPRGVRTGAEPTASSTRHAPLPEQFADQQVRQIELDVFVDTRRRPVRHPAAAGRRRRRPYDPAMEQPGHQGPPHPGRRLPLDLPHAHRLPGAGEAW